MTHQFIMSGFGGQGVLLIGQLMTYGGMIANKQVSWIPSYGPEMRGGTANCSVIISEEAIGAPIVTEPTAVVAMNLPSMEKFEDAIVPGGVMIVNSSLINEKVKRKDIKAFYVPANEIATELGNLKVANMVVLGALAGATQAVSEECLLQAFKKIFASKPKLVDINKQAIERGSELVQKG